MHWSKFSTEHTWDRIRACADRDLTGPCGKRRRDAPSFGELPSFPNDKEHARARTPTIPHRAHLRAVPGLATRQSRPSPFGLPQASHPRPGDLGEGRSQILVFGCAYRRIAEEGCSATAIRDRRDEWIELGVMEALRQIALESYDRFIGLELEDVAVDGCITKAPCGREKAGKSPVDRGKQGTKRSTAVDGP